VEEYSRPGGGVIEESCLCHDLIHGGLTLRQRLKVLKEFKVMLGPDILLMTLGTGAEGFVLLYFTILLDAVLANRYR
jgi:hypothetical protein